MKKYLCEFLGTCILVLFGCGVAILTKGELVATSLAFGNNNCYCICNW